MDGIKRDVKELTTLKYSGDWIKQRCAGEEKVNLRHDKKGSKDRKGPKKGLRTGEICGAAMNSFLVLKK